MKFYYECFSRNNWSYVDRKEDAYLLLLHLSTWSTKMRDGRILRVLTLRLGCRKRDWKKKDAYLLSHDMKSIERVLKVLMLRLGCRKRNWKKRDAYLLLLHLLTWQEATKWKNIESIDVKVTMKERLEKERCLPSTLKSINMINEDERWKSIESINVKVRMQKERLEKERCLPSILTSINMTESDKMEEYWEYWC